MKMFAALSTAPLLAAAKHYDDEEAVSTGLKLANDVSPLCLLVQKNTNRVTSPKLACSSVPID